MSILALFIGLCLVACGGPQTPDPVSDTTSEWANDLADAPNWVITEQCPEEFADNVICSVGVAEETRNISLARTTAQTRGRTTISQILESRVENMVEDYQATVTDFSGAASDEQAVDVLTRQLTDTTISGVQQVDAWISPAGRYFVLMALDSEEFAGIVEGMEQLNEQVRQAITQRAREGFGRMDEQLNNDGN
jgi:hypothetical protein